MTGILSCSDSSKKAKVSLKRNDSLDYFLEKSYNDTVPKRQKYLYADKALTIVSNEVDDSMNRVNYFKVANRYFYLGNRRKYEITTRKIIKRAVISNDTFSLAKGYQYLGDISKIDSSFYYYFQAEKLFVKIKNYEYLASVLLNKAGLQYSQKDYIGCEKSTIAALKLIKISNPNNKSQQVVWNAYLTMGAIYTDLEEFPAAINYYKMAIKLWKTSKYLQYYERNEVVFNNIGIAYEHMKDYKKAIECYEVALFDKNLRDISPNLYAQLKNNIAYSNFKLGNYKSAFKDFSEAKKVSDRLTTTSSKIAYRINMAEYYKQTNIDDEARKLAKEAYNISKKEEISRSILKSLKTLTQVDPANASKYFTEFNKINDSLQLAERQNRDKFARIEYETEELITDKKNLIEEKDNYLYSSIGFLLLVLVFVVFGYYVLKNRQTQLKREQEKANAEIYRLMLEQGKKVEEGKQLEKKRISQELHDGVMSRLTSIRLNLFILRKKTDPETIQKCIGHINEIQDIEKEIRAITYDLQKNVLSGTINFDHVVRKIFTDVENHSDINFKLHSDVNIDWVGVDSKVKMQIYRILQEAIQNIDKYAAAQNVNITMRALDNTLLIEITDDGVGFDESKIEKGIGIKSMYTRAKEIAGEIFINSAPGQGTSVRLKVQV
ncbi:tetratricopeptide repeat-containing sensor histidine kinase [Flavobacterium sp. 3HN19-14]|uniref:tetratricopeptide repeat-containing sensor histidine kinase n=1 Tax=Flavobacterium sp. 3HN19-14 TaxID=3448133 RepID=UPI003EE374DC